MGYSIGSAVDVRMSKCVEGGEVESFFPSICCPPENSSQSIRMCRNERKRQYRLALFRRRQDQGARRKLQEVEFGLEPLGKSRKNPYVCTLWRAGFREASKVKVKVELKYEVV